MKKLSLQQLELLELRQQQGESQSAWVLGGSVVFSLICLGVFVFCLFRYASLPVDGVYQDQINGLQADLKRLRDDISVQQVKQSERSSLLSRSDDRQLESRIRGALWGSTEELDLSNDDGVISLRFSVPVGSYSLVRSRLRAGAGISFVSEAVVLSGHKLNVEWEVISDVE